MMTATAPIDAPDRPFDIPVTPGDPRPPQPDPEPQPIDLPPATPVPGEPQPPM